MHIEEDECGEGDVNDEPIQGRMGIVGQATTSAQNYPECKAQNQKRKVLHVLSPRGTTLISHSGLATGSLPLQAVNALDCWASTVDAPNHSRNSERDLAHC